MAAVWAYMDAAGLRHVPPYEHTYRTTTKGRWAGMPLLEAFSREFAIVEACDGPATAATAVAATMATGPVTVSTEWRANATLYAQKMATGALRVGGRESECRDAGEAYLSHFAEADAAAGGDKDAWFRQLPKLVILRQLNEIAHTVQRIEHPVCLREQPIEVIHCSGGDCKVRFIAVNKPPTIAIHPGGRFHRNTLLRILEDVFGGVSSPRVLVTGAVAGATPQTLICEAVSAASAANGRAASQWYPVVGLSPTLGTAEQRWLSQLAASAAGGGPGGGPVAVVGVPAAQPIVVDTTAESSCSSTPVPLKLHIVHRLDRCTSGVVVFALDSSSARAITSTFADERDGDDGRPSMSIAPNAKKVYLARVAGDIRGLLGGAALPASVTRAEDGSVLVSRGVYCASHQASVYWCLTDSQQTEYDAAQTASEAPAGQKRQREGQPYASVEAKREAMRARVASKRSIEAPTATLDGSPEDSPVGSLAKLRYARTVVRFVSFHTGSNESVVECSPLTGRTHQIRVHLASLGYPIVGDHKYAECRERFSKGLAVPSTGEGDDADAICLHAMSYSVMGVLVTAPPPAWARETSAES